MKYTGLVLALALLSASAVALADSSYGKDDSSYGSSYDDETKTTHKPIVIDNNLDPIPYNPKVKKIELQRVVDTRLPGSLANFANNQASRGKLVTDADGNVVELVQTATQNYPDKLLERPDGWRVGVKANNSIVVVSDAEAPAVLNTVVTNAKLAPAISLGSTNLLTSSDAAIAYTDAQATARPGLQYGAVVAVADNKITANNQPDPFVGDAAIAGGARARATAGQGQTVALARDVIYQNGGGHFSDVRTNANSARWYMSPGHAIAGAANVGRAGRVSQFTEGRARSELGTASSGVLNWGVSNGITPFSIKLVPNNIYSEIDNKVNNDAGNAAAGYLNIQKSYNGKVAIRNFPGSTAATAVGNAVAGGVTVAYSENGKAQVGDYDQENDSPENDVAATTRGRGTAEAGQINISLAPNNDAEVLGDVKATANQGSAVAGAVSVANAYQTSEMGVDVNARTSEYDAIAVNIGVAQASERSVISDSATAKTTTGSALAFNEANAAVSGQNSATTSADATTTTGQAAAIALSQSVGGVHSDSQGAASATTSTGNALSIGSGFSGSAFTTRAVSTSAAASKEGQAVSASLSAAVSGDATADTASSAATTTGNAASAAQGYGLGVFQGKATVASSSGTESGSAGSLAVGVATGLVQAQSKVASSAETKDGRAQSLAGALSAAGINSIASATSSGASETGDVTSNAQSFGLGAFHGEASAASTAATGCTDCVSDAVANALSTGFIADSIARAAADTPSNPGNALANAMAIGAVSRTSNGGSSRIAVGPGQALSGGFAVSAGKKVQDTVKAAVNPAAKRAAVQAALKA